MKETIAVDLYNLELTGEIAPPLTAAVGGVNTTGGKVLEIEGTDRRGFIQSQFDGGGGDDADRKSDRSASRTLRN